MNDIDENEFVDIPEYEGLYQINRKGEVKSLERLVEHSLYGSQHRKELILKSFFDTNGYKKVELLNKAYSLHKLLYKSFIADYDDKYFQIDHIDRDKQNNNLNNLRIVSNRNNCNNKTNNSIFGVGVTMKGNKFKINIQINKKTIHLGIFETPDQAQQKYLEVKKQIEEIEKITRNYTFNRYKKDGEYFIEFFPIL